MEKIASEPLYARVEDVLASDIANGTLLPGARLPAEQSLTERFAVSRTTIRQAVQNLIRRGLVEIRRGKGTFVTLPKISQELTELTGFVEDMQVLGRHASARLIDQQIVPADESVGRGLGLAVGTLIVRIQRVRLADNIPLRNLFAARNRREGRGTRSGNRTHLYVAGTKVQHAVVGSGIPPRSRNSKCSRGSGT